MERRNAVTVGFFSGLTTHALTEISDLGSLYDVMRISKTATIYTRNTQYIVKFLPETLLQARLPRASLFNIYYWINSLNWTKGFLVLRWPKLPRHHSRAHIRQGVSCGQEPVMAILYIRYIISHITLFPPPFPKFKWKVTKCVFSCLSLCLMCFSFVFFFFFLTLHRDVEKQ